MKTNKKIFLSIIAIIFIFFTLFPIDITNKASQITAELEDKFDGKIEISRALLYPLPYPRIVLEDFQVTKSDEAFLSTKKMKINLKLFSLLTKKIVLKKLTFIGANIVIAIDSDGKLKLKGEKVSKSDKPEINLPPIYIEDSSISIINESSEEGLSYSLFGITGNLKPIGTNINFKVEGFGTNEGLIQLTGSISQQDSNRVIEGNIDAKHMDLEPFKKYLKFKNNFIIKEGLGSINADYGLTLKKDGTDGFLKGQLAYNNLLALIPQALTNDFNSPSGSLSIDLSWKDKVSNLLIEDINSDMDGFKLLGSIKIGTHDNNENKGITIDLNSTALPVSFAEDIKDTIKVSDAVAKWTDALEFKEGQMKFKKFYFYFDFITKKPKLTIELDFLDTSLKYQRVESDFTDLWGTLTIESEENSKNTITIKNLSGLSDKSSFTINGEVRNFRELPYIDITGDLQLGSNVIEPLANSFNFDLPVISDSINVVGTFKGPIGSLVLETTSDFTNTNLIYRRLLNKPKGFPLTIKSSLTQQKNSYMIREGLMLFGESSLNFNGLLEKAPKQFKLALKAKDVLIKDLGGLISAIDHSKKSNGTVSIDVSAKKTATSIIPLYTGSIRGINFGFTTAMFASPINNANARINLEGNSGSIILEKGTIGQSIFSGKADITNIDKGKITFNAISPYLNIADILSTSKGAPVEPYITGSGNLSVKEGHGLGLSFKNFSTTIDITKEEVSIPITNMESNGGFVSGHFKYFRSYLNNEMFQVNLKAEKVNIESTLREFGMEENVHTGIMEIELCLSAKKGMDNFTEGLNGVLEIDAKDGHLEQLVAISKVMALFSPLAYDELFKAGFPYDKLDGQFKITNGVFRTNDLHMKSSALRLSGLGKINTNNGTIKMTLVAHPFTTVDLIRKIPFGKILLGEGFMSIYYRATGRALDPDIEALQAKSIENLTIGMIKRLYTRPRDILRGKEKLQCHWQ